MDLLQELYESVDEMDVSKDILDRVETYLDTHGVTSKSEIDHNTIKINNDTGVFKMRSNPKRFVVAHNKRHARKLLNTTLKNVVCVVQNANKLRSMNRNPKVNGYTILPT